MTLMKTHQYYFDILDRLAYRIRLYSGAVLNQYVDHDLPIN